MRRPKLPKAERVSAGQFVEVELIGHPPIEGHQTSPVRMVIEVSADRDGEPETIVEVTDADGDQFDYAPEELPLALQAIAQAHMPGVPV